MIAFILLKMERDLSRTSNYVLFSRSIFFSLNHRGKQAKSPVIAHLQFSVYFQITSKTSPHWPILVLFQGSGDEPAMNFL
jgi:hypothetical protein